MAKVVNCKRQKYDVYIGRPSKWGNPFEIGKDGDRYEVIAKFELYLKANKELMDSLHELKYKRLGCFCAPNYCHGDILVKYVEELEKSDNENILESSEDNILLGE